MRWGPLLGFGLAVDLHEVEGDDAGEPDDAGDDGESVEVFFYHGGAGQVGLHATAEEAGEAAAFASVE